MKGEPKTAKPCQTSRKEDPFNNFNIPTSSAEHRGMSGASPLAGAAGAVGGSEDPPA